MVGENHMHPEIWDEASKVIAEAHAFALECGFANMGEQFEAEASILQAKVNETSEAVCATITLKIEQKVTMTREAFRGTLSVTNGNETTAMRDVRLKLRVRDAEGNVATSHEFTITAESLTGFEGETSLTDAWTLAANAKGVATILFIPTKYAAPTEPVNWSFGGELTYIDPYSGLEVTRELSDVTLTVNPSPILDLTYFLQRDVLADDPLTDEIEPSKEAEFALLIKNKGYGDATDVRIVTSQPEIIRNDRNVKCSFDIVASQLNGKDKVLALKGESVKNNIGAIPAGSTTYAQWWLVSDMLGHFVNYNVEATHVTNYGNPDLTLLDEVTIHELIHSIELTSDDKPLRGFLVNDIADANDYPDMLYLTDGEVLTVGGAEEVVVEKKSATESIITVTPKMSGWVYANLIDPVRGVTDIQKIVRQSDGKEIPLQNFWQTDRTLRDGLEPLYENRLHLADEFASAEQQSYVITYNPTPDILLAVQEITPIPAEGQVIFEPLTPVNVTFTKPVDPATFTTDDISIAIQGIKQDVSTVAISTEDNRTFSLDLSRFTANTPNGYYQLTVQTAGINDAEGFSGKDGKTVGWVFYRDGRAQLTMRVYPENSGTITRTSPDEIVGYESILHLNASANEGYEFTSWTLNGKSISTEPLLEIKALSDLDIVANFREMNYSVTIETAGSGGSIVGAGSGRYEYGTQLSLTAVPLEDYVLKAWKVDGVTIENTNETLNFTVRSAQTITAVFEREFYRQSMTLEKGWNWVSSYISESWPKELFNSYANRIVGQFDELISDPEFGLIGGLDGLTSGVAYKMEVQERFTTNLRGHLFTTSQNLKRGWNWIAYPWTEARLVSVTIGNADEGDYLVSQRGFTEYADGYWEGSLNTLTPGEGYLYRSVSEKSLNFDFSELPADSRTMRVYAPGKQFVKGFVDVNAYPNTMSVTARLYQNGMDMTDGNYVIYAMDGDELRGVGELVGSNYYLTVYGDQPVDITFLVIDANTGESFLANEHLTFRDDVVGSRRQPFAISFGETTGIVEVEKGLQRIGNTVYDLQGRKVDTQSPLFNSRTNKGVYIVNGHKIVNGKYLKK